MKIARIKKKKGNNLNHDDKPTRKICILKIVKLLVSTIKKNQVSQNTFISFSYVIY